MTDREKLVELIRHSGVSFANYPITDVIEEAQRNLADHLIANGVTFKEECYNCGIATQEVIAKLQSDIANLRKSQTWISVNERLPEESGTHIVVALNGHAKEVTFVKWQKMNKMWNLIGARSYWKVTHWMPLPEPPGEE